jgi:hypothetical protein
MRALGSGTSPVAPVAAASHLGLRPRWNTAIHGDILYRHCGPIAVWYICLITSGAVRSLQPCSAVGVVLVVLAVIAFHCFE